MASPKKRGNLCSIKLETGVAIIVNATILQIEIAATGVRNQDLRLYCGPVTVSFFSRTHEFLDCRAYLYFTHCVKSISFQI